MKRILVAVAGVVLLTACERAQRAYDAFRTPVGEANQGPGEYGRRDWHRERGTHAVIPLPDGGTAEGRIVDGKREGHWVARFSDGGVWEGPYVNGKMEGRWVKRGADGSVWEGPYVNGKKVCGSDRLRALWPPGAATGESGAHSGEADHRFRSSRSPVGAKRRGAMIMPCSDRHGSRLTLSQLLRVHLPRSHDPPEWAPAQRPAVVLLHQQLPICWSRCQPPQNVPVSRHRSE